MFNNLSNFGEYYTTFLLYYRHRNMTKRIIPALFMALAMPLMAQMKTATGITETTVAGSTEPTVGNPLDERVMTYFPDGRDIVCLNGSNRYTRPLYGTHTLFRLETSDRPIFATYNKELSRNIRLFLTLDGITVQLDSTDYCEARYQGGRRTYLLRDSRWPKGAELRLTAMASFQEEGCLFRIEATGFKGRVTLSATSTEIARTKMSRGGDLGIDSRDKFEARQGEGVKSETVETCLLDVSTPATSKQRSKSTASLPVQSSGQGSAVAYLHLSPAPALSWLDAKAGQERYETEEQARLELFQRVEFNTPNPFINTLGGNLVMAADGLWDGETWLHGCVGWRTQLAGWRAAYAGDALGWTDRAVRHFNAYARSQVTDVPCTMPHPTQDSTLNLARAVKKWGTPMYSNGYICKLPNRKNVMNHYDMNLNYIDELLWHFQYDASPDYMREMWPVLKLHLAWEKMNYDPDNDHLYDAYCCIWASDALYYNSGAVTHSSAYNYRGNLLAARIAELIGEDPAPYKAEAEAILKAMNARLWMDDEGCWAEFQDFMGLKRLHRSPAVWTVYTPIDCDACTPEQAFQATKYVDRNIPHIPVRYRYSETAQQLGLHLPAPDQTLATVSTTNWMPYVWSTNNVAHEEVANMALAYLQAGRSDSGYKLLMADIMDGMYLGKCPSNFGQISFYDRARSEAYRDFGDNVGIMTRTFINGLFGIIPNALYGECFIKPAFPDDWQTASIRTPYLSYEFRREEGRDVYEVEQHFARPLQIVVRANAGGGAFLEVKGTTAEKQTIIVEHSQMPQPNVFPEIKPAKADVAEADYMRRMGLDDVTAGAESRHQMVDMTGLFNSNVDDIYENQYLSPRSPYTTLELPTQGVGEWCLPKENYVISDSVFRTTIQDDVYDTHLGLSFRSPAKGHNILYTSLWDNYPSSATIPVKGRPSAAYAYLLMAGSTNNMQSRIENARIVAEYTDGTKDTLRLENPINWCTIEQDYYYDDYAFWSSPKHTYRVMLNSGKVERGGIDNRPDRVRQKDGSWFYYSKAAARIIPCGAAQLLKMPLNPRKKLRQFTLTTLSNDVVVGLMGITLERPLPTSPKGRSL